MAARTTYATADEYRFECWLIFDYNGTIRMAHTRPTLRASERAMFLSAKLPKALWHTPTLKAFIDVAPGDASDVQINLQAAAE